MMQVEFSHTSWLGQLRSTCSDPYLSLFLYEIRDWSVFFYNFSAPQNFNAGLWNIHQYLCTQSYYLSLIFHFCKCKSSSQSVWYHCCLRTQKIITSLSQGYVYANDTTLHVSGTLHIYLGQYLLWHFGSHSLPCRWCIIPLYLHLLQLCKFVAQRQGLKKE